MDLMGEGGAIASIKLLLLTYKNPLRSRGSAGESPIDLKQTECDLELDELDLPAHGRDFADGVVYRTVAGGDIKGFLKFLLVHDTLCAQAHFAKFQGRDFVLTLFSIHMHVNAFVDQLHLLGDILESPEQAIGKTSQQEFVGGEITRFVAKGDSRSAIGDELS